MDTEFEANPMMILNIARIKFPMTPTMLVLIISLFLFILNSQ